MIKKTQIIGVILFLALLSGIFMGNSIFLNEKEEEDADLWKILVQKEEVMKINT